jgi:hypothetical protein
MARHDGSTWPEPDDDRTIGQVVHDQELADALYPIPEMRRDVTAGLPDDRGGQRYADLAPTELAALPDPVSRPAWRFTAVRNAAGFLLHNLHLADLPRRAAVVLMAGPAAAEAERVWGGRASLPAMGLPVQCGECRREWDASPEDPYLNAGPDHLTGGTCTPCFMLAQSRRPEAERVLDGTIVTPGEDTDDD